MATGALIAYASPVDAASEEEFNRWYSEVHIPQVREAIPAITDVRRFRVVNPAAPQDGNLRYVAIYSIDGDVVQGAGQLGAFGAAGKFTMTPAIDSNSELIWVESV